METEENNHRDTGSTEMTMADSLETKWRPHTAEINGDSFEDVLSREENLAVHFWAAWDLIDREMGDAILRIESRLDGWIKFYSCDIDDPANLELCKQLQVASIPCVLIFSAGKKCSHIIGISDDMTLASEILQGLTKDSQLESSWWRFW